ncbi:putative GEM-like protein 8 [Phalaenopsis equestris]|uniref:putative GEM-like protein 8 n=1 Tax=Phalaenopsis equestris TaxID=78828 RepID=UPI0009E58B0E|nr:putative GEM-like protein 8 [Phalaenopsis equestris]
MDLRSENQEEAVVGIPYRSPYRAERPSLKRKDSMVDRLNKLRNKADSFVHGVRDHVSVGHNISKTVKGKLSLGARIINSGGFEGVFRKSFSAGEEEDLLRASQCYMSTTAGPVAGVLFVSTDRIGFCSERAIKVSTTIGNSAKVPYKALIPLKKIEGAFSSENVENPNQKYMYIVTVDGFELWFLGFVNYKKTFKSVQKAILERFEGREENCGGAGSKNNDLEILEGEGSAWHQCGTEDCGFFGGTARRRFAADFARRRQRFFARSGFGSGLFRNAGGRQFRRACSATTGRLQSCASWRRPEGNGSLRAREM